MDAVKIKGAIQDMLDLKDFLLKSIAFIESRYRYNLHFKLQAAVLRKVVLKKINTKLAKIIDEKASEVIKISLEEEEVVAIQIALNNGWYTMINSFSGQNFLRQLQLQQLKCPIRDEKDLLPGEEWEADAASYLD